jgi:predicted transglutaminase-like cysteine proteinase
MKIAEKTHWDVLTHFVYVPDKIQHPDYFDHWASHADAVEAGEIFRDDCDGFALTCAELLVRSGQDKETVRIAMCKTETNEGHLVCVCNEWVLDNRQRFIKRWSTLPYEWISSMKMSEPGTWRTT